MALSLFTPSRKETALRKENVALESKLRAAKQRVSEPIVQQSTTFLGFGNGADDRKLIDAVIGTSASAIRVVRQRVQGLQRGVFIRRFQDGKFVDSPAFDHPLQLLLDNPTRREDGSMSHTGRQLWGMVVTQHQAAGQAYQFVNHDRMETPRFLQMARPGTVTPLLTNGVVSGYRVASESGGGDRILRAKDIIRYWEPDPCDLFSARGIMAKSQDLIEMDQFAQRRWAKFYQNDATPKLAFEATDPNEFFPLSEEQEELNRTWVTRFNRIVGKFKASVGWVKPGWKVVPLKSEDEAGSGVTFMTFSRRGVYQQFGVPTSLVGDIVDVNRAAAETTRFSFDQNTVEPITLMIDDALTHQLASQYPVAEGVQLIVKTLPFKAEDKEFNLLLDESDLKNLVRTVDEVREGREPSLSTPSGWGALPIAPFNLTPFDGEVDDELDLSGIELEFDEAAAAVEEEDEEERLGEGSHFATENPNSSHRITPTGTRQTLKSLRAHFSPELEWERQLLRDQQFTPKFRTAQKAVFRAQAKIVLMRFLATGRQRAQADDILKEIFPKDGWGALFEESTKPVREAAYLESASSATQAISQVDFKLNKSAVEALAKMNFSHIKFTNEATARRLRKQIAAGLDLDETQGQIARRITDVFGQRRKDATRIARTEIASAVSDAQIEGYKQTGVVEQKQWNTSLDADVRDDHQIEGQTRDLDEDFDVGGESANAPADPSLSAGNRINCRCFTTPVFSDEMEIT